MDGKLYSNNRYNSDICEEPPFVEDAIIGELGLQVGQRILYLFDFGDMWKFDVQLIDFIENYNDNNIPIKPQIIKSK